MATQIFEGSVPQAMVDACNETHAAAAAAANKAHYDGPEWAPASSPVEQALATLFPVPYSLTDAARVLNQAKALHTDHISRINEQAETVYAHKSTEAGDALTASDLTSAAVFEEQLRAYTAKLANDIARKLVGHMLNNGAGQDEYHTTSDEANAKAIQVSRSVYTREEIAERLNLCRAVYEAHRQLASPVHGQADGTNAVSSHYAEAADWDSIVALAEELRVDFNLHRIADDVHPADDGVNIVIADTEPEQPSDLFTLAADLHDKHNQHVENTDVHVNLPQNAPTLPQLVTTTRQGLVEFAQQVREKQSLHFRDAPQSRALRIVPKP